jgi:hypothetical protein
MKFPRIWSSNAVPSAGTVAGIRRLSPAGEQCHGYPAPTDEHADTPKERSTADN